MSEGRSQMSDFEKVMIALIVLALVAVVVGSGQAQGLISTAGDFLVSMVKKTQG